MDTKYNGWANKPTWLVNLWLTNDESTEAMLHESARNACETGDDREDAAQLLAGELEQLVENMRTDDDAGLLSDLLGWAMAHVEWYEIAEHYVNDVWDEIAAEMGAA